MLKAQRIGGATGHQAPLMQNQQIIAGLHFVQQMSGPQHTELLLAAQPAQVLVKRQAAGRIEADAGFVQQQQARFMQQRAGNFHPPPMADVQLTHTIAPAFTKALAGQFGFDPQVALTPRQAMQGGVVAQVLLNAQVQVQGALLKHHAQLAQGRACSVA